MPTHTPLIIRIYETMILTEAKNQFS